MLKVLKTWREVARIKDQMKIEGSFASDGITFKKPLWMTEDMIADLRTLGVVEVIENPFGVYRNVWNDKY